MDNLFCKNQINQAKKMLDEQMRRVRGDKGKRNGQLHLQEDFFKSLNDGMNQRLNQAKQFQGNEKINSKIDQNRTLLEQKLNNMNEMLKNLNTEEEGNKLDALHKKMSGLLDSFLEKEKK
ncbi:hypothetical protein [Chengkuizengella axinellae]|uniref:DUF5082 domain-containing protein n=1 Tax=Chengkuizengella axinellae TaxID=3064388 RepID=A0ABT9IXN1_9BACL|nr:hypothetical protein [Chengkuizengella sp. 2205SS18-9]MDP5274085.1 hypothetical protein [Chengkuizengella sp. 2205SS18-9]